MIYRSSKSGPASADLFISDMIKKFQKIEYELQKINETHKIPKDPHLMIEGPSPMFEDIEEAKRVMENPDIIPIKAKIKETIDNILRE